MFKIFITADVAKEAKEFLEKNLSWISIRTWKKMNYAK